MRADQAAAFVLRQDDRAAVLEFVAGGTCGGLLRDQVVFGFAVAQKMIIGWRIGRRQEHIHLRSFSRSRSGIATTRQPISPTILSGSTV